MSRPPLEVADIVRARGRRFVENNRRWIQWIHLKVLLALVRCRTAALGGHRDQCPGCGYQAISYNSCRNRHCPKCQTAARQRWLAARQQELLAVGYFHLVFTLPHQLSPLALQNKKVVYDLLFRTSAQALLQVAADPDHLGAEAGFLSVLHTGGQNLLHHPHIHCVIPAGGLSPDHTRWIHPRYPFLVPVKVLGRVFRGKFVAGLKRRFRQGQLIFAGSLQPLSDGFEHICHHERQSLLAVWLLTCLALTLERLYRLRYLHRGTHPLRTAIDLLLLWQLSLGMSVAAATDSS